MQIPVGRAYKQAVPYQPLQGDYFRRLSQSIKENNRVFLKVEGNLAADIQTGELVYVPAASDTVTFVLCNPTITLD